MAAPDADAALIEQNILTRIRSFNASLDRLMRLYTSESVDGETFVRDVAQETCKQLQVERVSIWSLAADSRDIHSRVLYESDGERFSSGLTLSAADFPRYFEAMLNDRVIDADDALTDRRTAEFRDRYLTPNAIFSMLDAQIRSAAGPRGVVCAESVGVQRAWTPDEIAYVVSVAELVGFSMDREDRRKVRRQLEEANRKLEEAAQQAKEATERYDLAMEAAFDGVWDWDLTTDRFYFTEQNYTLLGEPVPATRDDPIWWRDRVHEDDMPEVRRALMQHFTGDEPFNIVYRIRHRDGGWRWWRSRGRAVRGEDFKPTRFVGTNADITSLIHAQKALESRNSELERAKTEIEKVAHSDSLTDLPNRRYMERACQDLFAAAKRDGRRIALLHVDLDHFKEINDNHGHAAGDFVLQHAADILKASIDESDFASRVGGDEFVAIVQSSRTPEQAIALAETVLERLSRPVHYKSHRFRISASIGVALSGDDTPSASRLHGNADIALYDAKKLGRNRASLYDPQMRDRLARRRRLNEEIVAALESREFIPYFQPQFYASDLQLAGVEALVRWRHPTRGVVTPVEFLDAAEDLGCIAEIDRQILEKSASIVTLFRNRGVDIPRLSVNISGARLVEPALLETVERLDFDKSALSFELVESILFDELGKQASENLRRLKETGVHIEVDDFGTGYSSIVSLLNIRPHRLKIDRRLVANIESDASMQCLVRSIVDIARALEIEVVAEGVETKQQIEQLSGIGCTILQGFGLARPMPPQEFLDRYVADVWTGPLDDIGAQVA